MIHVGICDDDERLRVEIAELINRKYPMRFQVYEYQSGAELVFAVETGQALIDVLLLDIRMPGMSGLETAKRIRVTQPDLVIILLTRYRDYVFDGYEVQAFHYLVKPVRADRFFQVFDKAVQAATRSREEQSLLVETRRTIDRIPLRDILFIESNGRKLTVQTAEAAWEFYRKLADVTGELEPMGFFRTHRSYLVNLRHVTHVDKQRSMVHLTANRRALVSKKQLSALFTAMQKWYKG